MTWYLVYSTAEYDPFLCKLLLQFFYSLLVCISNYELVQACLLHMTHIAILNATGAQMGNDFVNGPCPTCDHLI